MQKRPWFIKIYDKGNLGYPQISQKVTDLINLISKIFFVKVPDWSEEQTLITCPYPLEPNFLFKYHGY